MSGQAKQFMRLEGKTSGVIQGECRVRGYDDWIDIDDWSWDLKQHSAEAGGVTQAIPMPISFSKLIDRASTRMLHAMARGEKLTALIRLEEMAASQFALEIAIKDVQILDYGLDVKDGDKSNEAAERWTFDYREISFSVSGSEAGRGAKVTTLTRPVWSREEGNPVDRLAKTTQDMLKLAKDLTPKQLSEIWEQIKEDWKRNQLPGGGNDTKRSDVG